MNRIATAAGFDPARLAFAARTSVAACLALWLAWMLGLEHPQWAAMSVWAASQPLRGQLVEKCFFRFAGTVSGTVAGIALVHAAGVHPALLVIGLAAWVAACTGIGNVQRGFVSYGTVLAGYTAAMVSLLDAGHPENVTALGADRLATVLTGVAVATVCGLLFAPADGGRSALRDRLRLLIADLLDALAAAPEGLARETAGDLLGRLATVEEALDPHSAGSLRSRQEVRAARAVLIAGIGLLLDGAGGKAAPEGRAALFTRSAAALRAGDVAGAARLLDPDTTGAQATTGEIAADAITGTLPDLSRALRIAATTEGSSGPAVTPPPVILHRDWIGAREASLRAAGAILLVGGLWQVTGWSSGNFMLLGLSIMISVFSTFESPVLMMRNVFLGQCCGVLGMLVCRWLVWPTTGGEAGLVLTMMPFILFGSLMMAHRRTGPVAFDYNMVFLLLSQPHWPLAGNFDHSLLTGLSVVLAPLLAWAIYLTVFPANLGRRIDTLMRMMRRDLADLARDPGALAHRPVWRARLYHRMLRLIRMTDRHGRARDEAVAEGLAALRAGHRIMRLHRLAGAPGTGDSDRRACRLALGRAARFETAPDLAERALAQAEARFDRTAPV